MSKDKGLIKAIAISVAGVALVGGVAYLGIYLSKPAPKPDNPDKPDEPGVTLTYEVIFDVDGNQTTKTVQAGEYASMEEPSKEGYEFIGWILDGVGLVNLTEHPITQNSVFTAKFERLVYSAVIEVDGETITRQVNHGETITLEEPTKEGHNFVGWSVNGEIVDISTLTFTEDMTITAEFEIKTYTVTIDIDGTQTTQTVNHGATLTLEEPTKEGYTFKGFSLDGSTVIDLSLQPITEDTTLIAIFEKNVEYITDFTFEENTITAYTGTATEIDIPSSYSLDEDGKAIVGTDILVTNLGDNLFKSKDTITKIDIPNTITTIGKSVFHACSGLTSIIIPDSVTSLGERAFQACHNLVNVQIGTGLTEIPLYCFGSCFALNNVVIPNNITKLNSYSFQYCSSIENLSIPDGVTSMGSETFDGCRKLKSIKLSNQITSIGSKVFQNCESLTSITIPDSVKSLSQGVFIKCTSLASIDLGSGIKSTQQQVFMGCTALKSITIPASLTNLGNYIFQDCGGLETIVVEEGNTVYDSRENCNAIIVTATNTIYAGGNKTIIPSTVTTIGQYAFNDCTFTSFNIPNSVTSIEKYAFAGCKNITNFVIPDSVTNIGDCAFNACTSLKTITIGSGVSAIGTSAFYSSNAITKMIFKSVTPPTITKDIIPNTTCKIYVPDEALDAYKTATYYSTHASQFHAISELEA